MERLLRNFAGGFVGKRSRRHTSALIGRKGVSLCALVSLATVEGNEYHMVHVFNLRAEDVSRRVEEIDYNLAEEFRLYSWSGLLEFLNSLHAPDNFYAIEERARRHRSEFFVEF